uniref:50S ribosomal protein L21, chloroplastic n=1 Tax=Synarthrophyton chejuense TaxID=2485825 RepID=A0A3G3MFP8_9FLOR|nr:ribosomal protein L21 [Synarthrophyton chejuense]AYR05647.1 ribosomal protein L21 [Synarthrophyton chejuense]
MKYAVIEISGRQFWVEEGNFYDVNKVHAQPGETIILNKVLFLNKEGLIQFGSPCIDSFVIKAKVLKHLKSRKITVFKMKSKKNMKSKNGHRQDLTRLLIQEI